MSRSSRTAVPWRNQWIRSRSWIALVLLMILTGCVSTRPQPKVPGDRNPSL
jgi:hypothetical protein